MGILKKRYLIFQLWGIQEPLRRASYSARLSAPVCCLIDAGLFSSLYVYPVRYCIVIKKPANAGFFLLFMNVHKLLQFAINSVMPYI